jgi:hypothetical protein
MPTCLPVRSARPSSTIPISSRLNALTQPRKRLILLLGQIVLSTQMPFSLLVLLDPHILRCDPGAQGIPALSIPRPEGGSQGTRMRCPIPLTRILSESSFQGDTLLTNKWTSGLSRTFWPAFQATARTIVFALLGINIDGCRSKAPRAGDHMPGWLGLKAAAYPLEI